jgi:hypothetical protein
MPPGPRDLAPEARPGSGPWGGLRLAVGAVLAVAVVLGVHWTLG